MTSRNAWKEFERRVALDIDGKRNPLSGVMSLHTSGDVIHPHYYIEVKMRNRLDRFLTKQMRQTLKETMSNARKEAKDWVIVFRRKYQQKTYGLTDFKFLAKLLKMYSILKDFIEKLDELNAEYGEKDNLCLYCNSDSYSPEKGIVHKEDCYLKQLREMHNESD